MKKRFFLYPILLVLILLASCSVTYAASGKVIYSITYNANGGKGAPKKQVKKVAKKKIVLRLSKQKPVRSGYVFRAWNTKKNGSGKNYKPGSKITIKKNNRTVKLFAVWEKVAPVPIPTPTPSPTPDPTPDPVPEDRSSLEVHFIDVGQGDATLILCDGEAMLIDTGGNAKGTFVQNYLMKSGVKNLKYAVGTHPDEDHIGGLDVVITKFNVETLLMPSVTNDTRTYDDVIQAAKYRNLKITTPTPGSMYSLGKAQFQIVSTGKTMERIPITGRYVSDWFMEIRVSYLSVMRKRKLNWIC